MRKAVITLRGISPLLMCPMSAETLESLRTGVRPQIQKDRPKDEIAAAMIRRDDKGHIALPTTMLFAALKAAGRKVKMGKSQISTSETTTLPDFMEIDGEFMPFTNVPDGLPAERQGVLYKDLTSDEKAIVDAEHKFWSVDIRRGVGQTGTAVAVVRPKFKEWVCSVTICYDEKKASESTLKELFRIAGSSQGFDSFRPSKGGPFGRFVVSGWAETAVKAEPEEQISGEAKREAA